MELKSIEKTQTTKYQIRFRHGSWADIFLEDWELGKSGKVLINSDWGTWDAAWGAMGDDIRGFLLRIDNSYLIKNLDRGREDYFNEEATLKEIKEGIIATRLPESRRPKQYQYCWPSYDKEEARWAWDSLMDFWDEFRTADGYINAAMRSSSKWLELWDDPPCPPCVTGPPPRLLYFVDKVWSVFLETIRREKEAPPQ